MFVYLQILYRELFVVFLFLNVGGCERPDFKSLLVCEDCSTCLPSNVVVRCLVCLSHNQLYILIYIDDMRS